MTRTKVKIHLPLLLIAILLIGLSLWRIAAANNGIQITRLKANGLPLTILTLSEGDPAERPLVLVAHGFAGSEVLMRGFSLTLARAGYTVAAWDFAGHGANPAPLDTSALIQAPNTAFSSSKNRGLQIPPAWRSSVTRWAAAWRSILGCSTASAAATIAISPVSRQVTPESPANLLLMAGELEPPFLETARQILDFRRRSGRRPGAGECPLLADDPGGRAHLDSRFLSSTHAEARHWLDSVFGPQNNFPTYQDWRIGLVRTRRLGADLAGPRALTAHGPWLLHLSPPCLPSPGICLSYL